MRREEERKRLCVINKRREEEAKDRMLYYLSSADVNVHYLSSWAERFVLWPARNFVHVIVIRVLCGTRICVHLYVEFNQNVCENLDIFTFLYFCFGHFCAVSQLHN